jgi:hypothetical protein
MPPVRLPPTAILRTPSAWTPGSYRSSPNLNNMTQQMRPPGAPKINIPSAAPNTTTNGGAPSSTTPTSEPTSVAPSTTPAIAGLPSIPSILATSPYDTSQPRVNTLYPLAGPPIFAPNESLFSPAKEPDYSPQYTILGAEPPRRIRDGTVSGHFELRILQTR